MREGTRVGLGRRLAGAARDASGSLGRGSDQDNPFDLAGPELTAPAERAGESEFRAYCQSPAPHESTTAGAVAQSFAEAGVLPDTGERSEYDTGAVRDASIGKGHYSSIPPCMIERLAKRFEDGARKYEDGNWMKGIPLRNYYDSAYRHLQKWGQGEHDEDHLAAAIWNLVAGGWTERQIMEENLPTELDDLPYRLTGRID